MALQRKIDAIPATHQQSTGSLVFRKQTVTDNVVQGRELDTGNVFGDLLRCGVVTGAILVMMVGLYVYLVSGGWKSVLSFFNLNL